MKRNKKILFSALAVMLVMVVSITLLSFSLADNAEETEIYQENETLLAIDTTTNIDNIIKFSNGAGLPLTDDGLTDANGIHPSMIYNIVEIGSSASPSGLKAMVESEGFKNYVVDGNRTIVDLMKAGCVKYTYYEASTITKDSTEALANTSYADLIYLSLDATKNYSASNDLCEELYQLVNAHANAKYKPLIIDSPVNIVAPVTPTTSTMGNLAAGVYEKDGSNNYTFKFNATSTGNQFFERENGSMFVSINGSSASKNWDEVILNGDTTTPYKIAKILKVNRTSGTAITDKIITGAINEPNLAYLDPATAKGSIDFATATNIFNISGTDLQTLGYQIRYLKPDYIAVDEAKITDLSTINLDQYDIIILEADCAGDISKEVYDKLYAAYIGYKHIFYDSSLPTTATSSSGTITDRQESNYVELFLMVANNKGIPNNVNVMVTNRTEFNVITGSNSANTAKVIADLINASSFRGIGGPSSTGSMFSVLEIQPCYPIDSELAASKNSYYNTPYPAAMVNGKTKEQVPAGVDYYKWDLSKAKIAHALDIPYDQIRLVQMSGEELAGYKGDIVGEFDFVYLGGNTSALKSPDEREGIAQLTGWTKILKDTSKFGVYREGNGGTGYPAISIYKTYSHTGDPALINTGTIGESGGSVKSGTHSADIAKINGWRNDDGGTATSFTLLNGNDVTYNVRKKLENYISSGNAFAYDLRLGTSVQRVINGWNLNDPQLQSNIDPDSNIFKILFHAYWDEMNFSYISTNNTIRIDNEAGKYGDTLTGYVEVFANGVDIDIITGDIITNPEDLSDLDLDEDERVNYSMPGKVLEKIYTKAKKRPKIKILSAPSEYSEFNSSTIITNSKLGFKYEVSGTNNYTVNLYIDDDGNNVFKEDELVKTSSNNILEYDLSSDFYGPLHWKLELVDNINKTTATQRGISYVQPNPTTAIQDIKVLQILPGATTEYKMGIEEQGRIRRNSSSNNLVSDMEKAQGRISLYFDITMQKSQRRLEYNPQGNSSEFNDFYDGQYVDYANGYSLHGNRYLGKYEPKFGLPKYDSSLKVPDGTPNDIANKGQYGAENWNANFADDISDRFKVDIDILFRSEFEDISKQIAAYYDFSKMTVAQKNQKISSFVIDQTDKYYKEYSALADSDLDKKLKIIFKKEAEEKASEYFIKYNEATYNLQPPEKILRDTLAEMVSDTNISLARRNGFQAILDTGNYWEYYNIDSRAGAYNDISGSRNYNTKFDAYIKAKDIEIGYKEQFKYWSYLSNPENWLLANYDTVIIGPAEDFGGDDIKNVYALADLKGYIQGDGNLIMFHDSLTKVIDNGPARLTEVIRPLVGMDRYRMEVDGYKQGQYYTNFKLQAGYDFPEKYYMTNLGRYSTSKKEDFINELYNMIPDPSDPTKMIREDILDLRALRGKYLSNISYTDSATIGSTISGITANIMPYKYAKLEWSMASHWYNSSAFSRRNNVKYGTDRTTQNNKGIVTTYPFLIGDTMNISPTHSQAYTIDLEHDDMTVWYSMAGGYNHVNGSSIYAASPNDAMDNYFIYSYGNVYYCGTGHSKVTGIHIDNNDERRLYINIICNSVRKSTRQPELYIYDYQKDTYGDKIKKNTDGTYYTKVEDYGTYPEFSFKVVPDPEVTLTNVKIYYDLDYSDLNKLNEYTNDPNHVLITDWGSANVAANVRKDVFRYDSTLKPLIGADNNQIMDNFKDASGNPQIAGATKLKLLEDYFAPYNGEYTYIVIAATDSAGKTVYQRIKVMMKRELFNLT